MVARSKVQLTKHENGFLLCQQFKLRAAINFFMRGFGEYFYLFQICIQWGEKTFIGLAFNGYQCVVNVWTPLNLPLPLQVRCCCG